MGLQVRIGGGVMEAAKVSAPVRAFTWMTIHPAKATAIVAAIVAALCMVSTFAAPDQAEAIPPLIIGLAIATLVGGAVVGIDTATTNFSDGLRDSCNSLLTFAVSVMHWSADLGMLTATFENLIPGMAGIIQGIHETVAIPVANIVLVIFLVVGLAKLISRAGQYETGIDVWQLVMVFVLYALMKACVDSSYAIMVVLYNMAKMLILGTKNYGFSDTDFVVQGIPDDVTGLGWLLTAWVICLIVVLIAWVVAAITYIVVLVRSVQIYVYTAFASIPLAFFISDGSRSVATGFLKRYIAVLGAGVIMALLLVMQSAIVGQMGATGTAITSFDTGMQFLGEIALSTVSLIGFAYCMFKSGSWARDFMGI